MTIINTSNSLNEFMGRKLHQFISEGEARQIEFCLASPTASQRGKRWAIVRVREIARDADIVDDVRISGGKGKKTLSPEMVAKKAVKRERDREIRSRMKGGSGKKK